MTRSEEMRKARETHTVAWQEFLIAVRHSKDRVHCFYEGRDAKYYFVRADLLLGSNPAEYSCGGKRGVLRVIELYRQQESRLQSRALFFVDSDYDSRNSLPNDSFVYVTGTYSVENYYVSMQAIENILRHEYSLDNPEDHRELKMLTAKIDGAMDEACKALLDLNVWLAARRAIEKSSEKKRLSLSSHSVQDFVEVSLERGIMKKYTISDLASILGVSSPTEEEIETAQNTLTSTELRRSLRGRYLLDVLRDILRVLQEDRGQITPKHFLKRGKSSLQLSKINLISELSQYADTPNELRAFFRCHANL